MDFKKKITIDEDKIISHDVDCPLCGSSDFTPFLSANNMRRGLKKEYLIAQCKVCHFRYVRNPPRAETLRFCYPPDYYSLRPEKISVIEKMYYSIFRSITEIKKGRLLDIGCGNCKYMDFMEAKGWDVHGYDMNPIPELAKTHKIIKGDLFSAGVADGYFDVITLWWSIEHMLDPLRVLKKCCALLRKGGMLIIATSNSASLEARLFKQYWHHLLLPEHCQQFTDQSLKAMVTKAGFTVQRIKYDLISLGFGPSLDYLLRARNIKVPLLDMVLRVLCIPIEICAAMTRQSGLITLYARK